ncbi:MAG: NAD+ synthase [Candidatus Caldarchaeum sp.]|nr:NAD+ synthase [Candidatus Caldarchaeales archaeon]MDJ0272557.1 NAD+ synthase [Candidatus Caldarchaeales archaeon]
MQASVLQEMLDIDYDATASAIQEFIAERLRLSGASGLVLGLSGGVDSSVVAALCVRALPSEKILGLIMPTSFTPAQDVADARALAEKLGISTRYISIDPIVQRYAEQLGVGTDETAARIAFANLRARIRMTILYFHANLHNLLVVGTGDRSEILLGYYTKYGDGGVDILPIGGLYKSQVRRLGLALGLPEHLANKPSSPQLYPGHRAVDELPADYSILDPLLHLLFDKKLSPQQAVEKGFEKRVVDAVLARYAASVHKREMPPIGPRPVPVTR